MYYGTGDESIQTDSGTSTFTNYGEIPESVLRAYDGPTGDTYDNILTPAQQIRIDAVLDKVKKEYDSGNRQVLLKILNGTTDESELMRRAIIRHVNNHPNMYAESMNKTRLGDKKEDKTWCGTVLSWLVKALGGAAAVTAGVSGVAKLMGYSLPQQWETAKPILSSVGNAIASSAKAVKGTGKEMLDAINPKVRAFRDANVSPEQYEEWEKIFQRTGKYPSKQEINKAKWDYMKPSEATWNTMKHTGYALAGLYALSKVAGMVTSLAPIAIAALA